MVVYLLPFTKIIEQLESIINNFIFYPTTTVFHSKLQVILILNFVASYLELHKALRSVLDSIVDEDETYLFYSVPISQYL